MSDQPPAGTTFTVLNPEERNAHMAKFLADIVTVHNEVKPIAGCLVVLLTADGQINLRHNFDIGQQIALVGGMEAMKVEIWDVVKHYIASEQGKQQLAAQVEILKEP